MYRQLICSILLAFSVSVSKQDNQEQQTLTRSHYNFNHPPSFENYNPLSGLDESEEYVQSVKKSKNGAIITRSLKDTISEEEPNESDLLEKSEENISDRDKEIDKIELESITQQTPVDIISESDKSQGNEALEGKSIKARNKKPIRRNQVQKFRSRTNERNAPVNQNLPTHVTENVTKKLLPTVSRDEDNSKIVSTEERSSRKGPKRTRERKPVIPIVENENFVYSHTGDFHYSYQSGDGTKAFERGELKTFEDNTAGEAVVGSFSYTDRDGKDFSLKYTADENGYRPEGAHLPTPPPIPPAIARALLYLSTKTTPQPATKSYF